MATPKFKIPKAPLLYALGSLVCMVIWFFSGEVEHLIFVAWFSTMSKLEEMSATKSAPLYGDVHVTPGFDYQAMLRNGHGPR